LRDFERSRRIFLRSTTIFRALVDIKPTSQRTAFVIDSAALSDIFNRSHARASLDNAGHFVSDDVFSALTT